MCKWNKTIFLMGGWLDCLGPQNKRMGPSAYLLGTGDGVVSGEGGRA